MHCPSIVQRQLYKTSLKIGSALIKIQTSYVLNKCLVLPHYTDYFCQGQLVEEDIRHSFTHELSE